MLDMVDLQEAWDLSPIRATWMPDSGTIHHTILLRTDTGSYALRAYRYSHEKRWRIESEHAVIAYVQEHGLPAIAPLPLSTGETILEHKGAFYALFPFAPGHQVSRSELDTGNASAMGKTLGQLHHVLRNYHPRHVREVSLEVDHKGTLERIDQIMAIIISRPELGAIDKHSLQRLAQRRDWLMLSQPADVSSLSALEQQIIHGDFQESNLFFADDHVSAIIDWDWIYSTPRAWEVLRVMHYAFHFNAEGCSALLDAYRSIMPLPLAELDLTARVYSWVREHELWLYEELYLQGNQRVLAFIHPGGNFVPLMRRWERLRQTLTSL